MLFEPPFERKTVFVARDAGITKGSGADVLEVSASMEVAYDTTSGAFFAPQGFEDLDGAHGWVSNGTTARYVDRRKFPPETSMIRRVIVNPGSTMKLVAESLGGRPVDLVGAGLPVSDIMVALTITNGTERVRHCTSFPASSVAFKILKGGGRKLVAKGGVPATCPVE
jgi:hypothetical protein